MIKVQNLQTAVELFSVFSESLRPYTFPKASPYMEDTYMPYRIWNFPIDGYDVCVYITDFEVEDNYAKNVQIFSANLVTLPFHLVFKIAAAFLGMKNIIFFYFVRDGRQVFCWTCMFDKEGNYIEYNKNEVRIEYYMGHEYASLID